MKRQSVRHRYGPTIFRFGGALVCAIALSASVAAFKPTAEFGHVGIVADAITPITRALSTGEVIKFSARAIAQIRDATAGVDEIFSARGELTVPEAHCDDELLPECTGRMIRIKADVIGFARAKKGDEARAQLGRALHTLQDFYAHSNWVNSPGPGNTSFNPTLGRATVPKLAENVPTCIDDFFDNQLTGSGLTAITTGYFRPEPPPSKCAHGVLPSVGIHKDAPGRPFFEQARARAVEGTRDFVNQILTALIGDDAAIRALMQSRGTLGFVIDTTPSMGGVISSVKTVVSDIVDAASTPDSQPDDYLLQTFNDPSIGTTLVTTAPASLLSAVNGLSVFGGGGDCPELSQAGLLAAIAGARNGSRLYFFSDASAKDSALADNVIAAATAKQITINYILNGSCSPVDPAYIRGAQETGGQLFFVTASEISKLFGLIQPTLAGDLQPLLIVNSNVTPGTSSYVVPVDSTMTAVTFSVSLGVPTAIRVRRPGGVEVLATDADATITTLSTGRIVTVQTPQPGEWRLELTGSGDLSASVMGSSALQLTPVAFVERRGRAEHEGLFPMDGQPVLGDVQLMRARMQGSVGSVRFEAVSEDGTRLDSLPLTPGDADAASDEYVGSVTLPLNKFRVYARGVDANGFAFVRAFPAVFGVQTVRVRATVPGLQLQPGQTTAVQFEITNVGPAASFAVTVADAARFATGVSPSPLALPSGGVGTVTVDVSVPTSPSQLFDTISVVARSTLDPSVSNSATIGMAVATPTITSITPSTGTPGQTLDISIAGESTHWVNGESVLSFSGSGITVNSIVVSSATTATANITIAPGAPGGSGDVVITTSGETAPLANGFTVAIPATAQPPTGLYASSIVGNVVTFRWTSPGAGLPPTDFVVEGGIAPGQVLASISTGSTVPLFTVTAPNGAFYVRARTVSGSSRSAASNEIRIFVNQPVAPSAPVNLLSRVSGNSLALSWRNTFGGGPINSLILDVTGAATGAVPLSLGESASFASVPSGTYTLGLRAANAFGASSQSAPIVVTVPGACSGVPQPPAEFLAFKVGSTVSVLWAPPTAGPAAASYELIVTGGFTLTIPTTQRALSGAVPAGTYNLSVRSVNACGSGAATPVTTIVIG